jgi:Nuclease A inhibitor-like protein
MFSQEAELYDEDDEDPEEKRYYTSLEPLDRLLVSNLSNLREYVVGCESVFYLYDVGQNSDGDWVGVSTIATWT